MHSNTHIPQHDDARMHRYCRHIFFLIFAAAACAGAQTQSDLSFRQSPGSARSVALGDAFVADARDASSVLWNPACLSFLQTLSVTGTAGLRTDDRLLRSSLEMPVLATEVHTVALGAESGMFDKADWSKHTGTMIGGEVSYAVRLMSSFSIGAIYNVRSVDFDGARATSHTAGIGVMYAVVPALTYGMSLTGFGSGIVIKRGEDGKDVLETNASIPRSVSFGASWRYPATHDRPIVAIYLSNQSISGEEHLVYRLGAEFFPWKFLALRGGIVSGPVTAVGRVGFGIKTQYLDIDYAVASSVAAERMQYVTISIPLPSK